MNDLIKTQKNKNLINFETLKPEDVFKKGGSDPIIEGLQKILDSHVPDVSTDKGRKAVASFSYSFSTSKTFLKEMGNKLTEKHKAIIKPITTERIKLEKACDSMRDQAREALNKWEEEQTRISNEKKARVKWEAAIEESRAHYDKMMIDAYYDNDMFDRELKMKKWEAEQAEIKKKTEEKEEAEKAEKERLENEARIKKETEEKAIAKEKELKDNAGNARVKMLEAVNVTLDFQSCREMPEETWINFYAEKNKAFQDIAKEKWMEEQKEKQRIDNEEKEKKDAEDAVVQIKNIRTDRLGRLGLTVVDNFFVVDHISVPISCLSVDDISFECVMDGVVKEINAEKERVEKIKAQKEQDEALEAQRKEQEEKERIEAKRLADLKAEEDRKAKNTNHQKSVNRKVVAKLMQIELSDKIGTYLTEEQALKITSDIVKNPVPQITINYGR